MRQTLIWDLPTRLFHALLVAGFLSALVLAETLDDDDPGFAYHMVIGLVLVLVVVLRVIWGLWGSRHARFGSLALGPRALGSYLRQSVTRTGSPEAGHNPAASWVLVLVLVLVPAVALSGVLQTRGSDLFKELHEILPWVLVGVGSVHVAGVLWHMIRHRDRVALSMVDGRKRAEPGAAIASQHLGVALAFLVLVGCWGAVLWGSLNPRATSVTLPLIGWTVGEDEDDGDHHDEDHDRSRRKKKKDRRDHDD